MIGRAGPITIERFQGEPSIDSMVVGRGRGRGRVEEESRWRTITSRLAVCCVEFGITDISDTRRVLCFRPSSLYVAITIELL